jgi:hypothetical protein
VSIRMLQLQDKDLQGGSAGALSQCTTSLLDVASSPSRVCSVFGTADLADLARKLCRATNLRHNPGAIGAVMLRRLPSRNSQSRAKRTCAVWCSSFAPIKGHKVNLSQQLLCLNLHRFLRVHRCNMARLKEALRRKVPHAAFEASATGELGTIRDSQFTAWLRS